MNNWDVFWLKNVSSSFLYKNVLKIHHNRVFKIYQKFLNQLKIKNPKIIELGCGSGELTARIIKNYGGSATLLDNSKEAIFLASKKFEKYGIKVKLLKKDLFKFKPKEKFDIVHSEGLIEHFLDEKQRKIIDAHKKHVKKDGYIIISIPRPAWYYKITKWILEKTNKWPFGFENAMNKYELKKALENCGLKVLETFEHHRYSFALAKLKT
jgi:cyclopropane fatty-acyl-phospholipid synthase-like methyltransferase